MSANLKTPLAFAAATIGAAILLSNTMQAYVTNGVAWGTVPVTYYINTANMDLPDASAEAAVQSGANVWAAQSGASVGFTYAGRSSQTTNTNDGINLVVFRNASSGSAIATTYWWSSGSRIIDADVVFWDGAFQFFASSTGCTTGFYIEDIAAHEFGHALGMGHSASAAATMYPSTSSCDMRNRTLDSDDIAGILTLYPSTSAPPSPPNNVRIVGN
jgi:matrixin